MKPTCSYIFPDNSTCSETGLTLRELGETLDRLSDYTEQIHRKIVKK